MLILMDSDRLWGSGVDTVEAETGSTHCRECRRRGVQGRLGLWECWDAGRRGSGNIRMPVKRAQGISCFWEHPQPCSQWGPPHSKLSQSQEHPAPHSPVDTGLENCGSQFPTLGKRSMGNRGRFGHPILRCASPAVAPPKKFIGGFCVVLQPRGRVWPAQAGTI